jgi:hypothetical protein
MGSNTDRATILAEHYHKTYDLAHVIWGDRNRTFLLLLVVTSLGAFINLPQPVGASVIGNASVASELVVNVIARFLDLDPAVTDSLKSSITGNILRLAFDAAVFYLLATLNHRTDQLNRHYDYLSCLEDEIRGDLEFSESATAFTREGKHYDANRGWFSKIVGKLYAALLSLIIIAYIYLKYQGIDWQIAVRTNQVDLLINLAGSTIIVIALAAYIWPTARSAMKSLTKRFCRAV